MFKNIFSFFCFSLLLHTTYFQLISREKFKENIIKNKNIIDDLWYDPNRYEGKDKTLPSYYDYIKTFTHFLNQHDHNIEHLIGDYARIANTYHFTERDIEEIVNYAAKEMKSRGKEFIDQEIMDSIIRAYKNKKIIDQSEKESCEKSAEGKIKKSAQKVKISAIIAQKIKSIYNIFTCPDTGTIKKAIDTTVEMQDEIFLGIRKLKNLLSKNQTDTPPDMLEIWEKTPEKHCTLEPYVAGEQPVEICQLINHLIHPKQYKSIPKKTILLHGPPGTGKTVISQSIAEILNKHGIDATLISQPASLLMNSYHASGPETLKTLFERADKLIKNGKVVIIFIDEIDAVAKSRSQAQNEEFNLTLNQLLVDISRYKANPNLIIIFASNLEKVMDAAILNRLNLIKISLPDHEQSKEIFRHYISQYDESYNTENKNENLMEFATLAVKYKLSGRDIENIVNSAQEMCEDKGIKVVIKEAIIESINKIKKKKEIEEENNLKN